MPFLGTTGGGSVKQYGGQANLGYFIKNSLRFRSGASGNLSRTPGSSSNQRTWTWSAWIKRGTLTTDQMFFSAVNTYMRWGNGTEDTLWLNFRGAGGTNYFFQTTQVFRDPAAWYHIVLAVDTTQATGSNRVKLYSNGVQITAFTTYAEYPPQDHDTAVNSTTAHTLGSYSTGAIYFDGYMAEINLIDGLQLTPSSFGKTDAGTNQWIPKKFAGTYGTNGFYLKFADASAATAAAIGKDSSGNGNNWTPSGISVTTGATYDAMTDSPTRSAAASNYATINALDYNSTYLTLNEGNLHQTYAGVSAAAASRATMAVPTAGKFYWEIYINATGGGSGERVRVGICRQSTAISGNSIDGSATAYGIMSNGQKRNNSTDSTYGAGYTSGQYIQVLYDATAGALYFGQNNSFANGSGSFNQTFSTATAAFTSLSSEFIPFFITYGGADIYVNFGQRPFAYTPPSGYVALNSFNLA